MTETINAVSLAIIDGSKVLFVKRTRAPFENYWSLPGGQIEPGESPEDAICREIREELGLTIEAPQAFREMRPDPALHYRLQVFVCTGFEGILTPNDEISAWQWASLHELAELETTPGLVEVVVAALHGAGN